MSSGAIVKTTDALDLDGQLLGIGTDGGSESVVRAEGKRSCQTPS